MVNSKKDYSKLCIHTITNKPWSLAEAVDNYAEAGVKGITVWQNAVPDKNFKAAGNSIRANGLAIISYCRGGFFSDPDAEKRAHAIEENKKMIAEASEIGAPVLVLVCGSSPTQSLKDSRTQIKEGIEALLPMAQNEGVKLAIEPLHPMYADNRSAINTLGQANDLAEYFNSPWIGVAVDVYHLWWDPDLEKEIARCGRNDNLLAYHICDWKIPTTDLLLDRGLMGEGCIPLKRIKKWVESAGFEGYHEVEIFSSHYWQMDQGKFLEQITEAYEKHCL
jgi:sugar phosphate isomerase/epimerase